MSSTVLEQLRSGHEEIECVERVIVSILNEKPRNHRERVVHGHKVSNLLDKVVDQTLHVQQLYDDADGTCQEETDAMKGKSVFTSFYEQLKEIRNFHRKYPNSVVSHEPELDKALNPQIPFSGEERHGKYVDLHEFYLRFVNSPVFKPQIECFASSSSSVTMTSRRKERKRQSRQQQDASTTGNGQIITKPMEYLEFLSHFADFSAIPSHEKLNTSAYQQYLTDLKNYLLDFYRRTQPLVDLEDVLEETRSKFDKEWALNQVAGWDSAVDGKGASTVQDKLFCEFCDKKFASKGVFDGHLSGKKHKKAVANAHAFNSNDSANVSTNGSANGSTAAASDSSNTNGGNARMEAKEMAFLEVLIRRMNELLTEVVHGTISYLELKQTRTHEELQAEIREEEEGAFSDVDVDPQDANGDANGNDDDDQPFYNPLNLPLGWDGKPIPYWLYKLHGLGVEYKCEICGNHSYWGRRAFDRHFQEWRHAFGMRCLKIPNTKHFHDITLMQDAIQLYEKLKDQIDAESWRPEVEEEFEDSEGNVLNRKTYEDLARQGLL